jgi:hypothetical protein
MQKTGTTLTRVKNGSDCWKDHYKPETLILNMIWMVIWEGGRELKNLEDWS